MGNRIRKLRTEKGLSGTKMARELGISAPQFYDLEKGQRTLSTDMAIRIAGIFDVSVDYLLGVRDVHETLENVGFEVQEVGDLVQVPIVGSVKAGPNGVAIEEIEGYEYTERHEVNGARVFWLRVKGVSMEGDGIFDNDLALVREQPEVDDGDLAVIIVNGEEGTLKRFYKDGDTIILQSSNPNFPPRIFSGEDKEGIRIAGKVTETKRKY